MSTHLTTQELDAARAKYRGKIIAVGAVGDGCQNGSPSGLRIERRTLKPGAVAPDFMLPDAHGRCVRLQSLLRQGPVVLVFYRGGCCPYCNLHLRGFQRALPEFQQFAAQIVAISPQLPDISLSTQEKDELTFAVLSDVGNKVARQFGIVFQIGEKLQKLYSQFGNPLGLAKGISLRLSPDVSNPLSTAVRHSLWCETWIRMRRDVYKRFFGAAVEGKTRI